MHISLTLMDSIEKRHDACLAELTSRNQQHVLRWWNELGTRQREELLADLESISWPVVDSILPTHVLARPMVGAIGELRPVSPYSSEPGAACEALYRKAVKRGRELLTAGKAAAFTVAGGQGTRLGFDGPKGMVEVTPVGGRSLFALFAEMVRAARKRYGASIPWYVMTSPSNHEVTKSYFRENNYFQLPATDVLLFPQGTFPVFDFDGRLLLSEKHRLCLAPNGHGGAFKAMLDGEALADMRRRGVEIISYFQVDNPLVNPFDPLFLGLHDITRSDMSTKVCRKADDVERVGNVCLRDGKLTVIEYTEFPESLARAKDENQRRIFDAGNLAIHLLNVEFVHRIAAGELRLPFRRAEKVVPFLDEWGEVRTPDRANAIKLETFLFDVLPLAENPLVLEVDRDEEFAPVKNAKGVDSLETSQRAQVRRACRWLERAGIQVPRKPDGAPDVVVAISPLLAMDWSELLEHVPRIKRFTPGHREYLESPTHQ